MDNRNEYDDELEEYGYDNEPPKKNSAGVWVLLSLVAVFAVTAIIGYSDPTVDEMKNRKDDRWDMNIDDDRTRNNDKYMPDYNDKPNKDMNDDDMQDDDNTIIRRNDYEPDVKKNTKDIKDDMDKAKDDAEDKVKEFIEDGKTTSVETILSEMKCPVSSEKITMDYSLNSKAVYSKTFNEYRSDHSGIDFEARLGEEVHCALKGTILEIREDSKLGTLVRVEHENAIITEYANLDKKVSVRVGDKVDVGDVIGKVGRTSLYEIADGEHLHFGVMINKQYVNPSQFIK